MLPNRKALLLGLMTGAVPVPVNATDNAVGFELAMVSVAARPFTAVGLNVTLIVQIAPPARLVPQLLVCAKSPGFAPVKVMPVIASVPVPPLESVTVWAALVVFTNWLPKLSVALSRVALAGGPTAAMLDHPEARLPRMEAFHAWDIVPAQPLSTASAR
jgi:hypothetical protein